jgi:hypothetical protein
LSEKLEVFGAYVKLIADPGEFFGNIKEIMNKTGEGLQEWIGEPIKKIGLSIAGAFAVEKIIEFGKECLNLYGQYTKAQKAFGIIAENAGVYTKENLELFKEQQEALKKTTEYEDTEIMKAQTMLMTHKLNADILQKTVKTAADMSEIMGGDLVSRTQMLGRVMENPLKMAGLLRRQGVLLNTEYMKSLTLIDQQNYVLDELNKRYAGTAEIMVSPYKQIDKFLEEIQKSFGKVISMFSKPIAKQLANELMDVSDVISELTKTNMEKLEGNVPKLVIDTNIVNLTSQYEALAGKTNKTAEEKKKLLEIQKELINISPDMVNAINKETNAIDTQSLSYQLVKTKAEASRYKELNSVLSTAKSELDKAYFSWEEDTDKKAASSADRFVNQYVLKYKNLIDGFLNNGVKKEDVLAEVYKVFKTESASLYEKKDFETESRLKTLLGFDYGFSNNQKTAEEYQKTIDRINTSLQGYIKSNAEIKQSDSQRKTDFMSFFEEVNKLVNAGYKLDEIFSKVKTKTFQQGEIKINSSDYEKFIRLMKEYGLSLDSAGEKVNKFNQTKPDFKYADLTSFIEKLTKLNSTASVDEITKKITELKLEYQALIDKAKEKNELVSKYDDTRIKALIDSYQKLLQNDFNKKANDEINVFLDKMKDNSTELDEITKKIQTLNKEYGDLKEKYKTADIPDERFKEIEKEISLYEKALRSKKAYEDFKKDNEKTESEVDKLKGSNDLVDYFKIKNTIEESLNTITQKLADDLSSGTITIEDYNKAISDLNKTTSDYSEAMKKAKFNISMGYASQALDSAGQGISEGYQESITKAEDSGDAESAAKLKKVSEDAAKGIKIAKDSINDFAKGFSQGGLIGGVVNMVVGWLMKIIGTATKFNQALGLPFAILGKLFDIVGEIVGIFSGLISVLDPFSYILEMIYPFLEVIEAILEVFKPILDLIMIPLKLIGALFDMFVKGIKAALGADGKEKAEAEKKALEEKEKENEAKIKELQDEIDLLKNQIDVLTKIKEAVIKAGEIQQDLLDLEKKKEEQQYTSDITKKLYSGLIQKISSEDLYKQGSFDINPYYSVIKPDGTIDTVLVNQLLTNLKYNELDASDIYGTGVKDELESLLNSLVENENNAKDINDQESSLKQDWADLQTELNELTKSSSFTMENLGTELYTLVGRIKAVGSDLSGGFTDIFPVITSGFDSVFAGINAKIDSINTAVSGKESELNDSQILQEMMQAYSQDIESWYQNKPVEQRINDSCGKYWYSVWWVGSRSFTDKGDAVNYQKAVTSQDEKDSVKHGTINRIAAKYGKDPSGFWFKEGGYTGNMDTDQIAGLVHGKEYVVKYPYSERYMSDLESMNKGLYGSNNPDKGSNYYITFNNPIYAGNPLEFVNGLNKELSKVNMKIKVERI